MKIKINVPPSKDKQEERPHIPDIKTSSFQFGTAEYGDLLFPEQLKNVCSNAYNIYELFEKHLPASGHLGLFISACIASIGNDERRQANAIIGALWGEGKTEILEKFCRYPHVNWLDGTTYADYLATFCGYYFDETSPPGREQIKGVHIERTGGITKALKTMAVDYIKNRFDIYHAGENITSIFGFEKLLALWMGLIEKGHWNGGNRWVGRFIIGSPTFPIKHGVVLASTMAGLKHYWFKEQGFLSRCILVFYYKNKYEHDYIIEGRKPPKVRLEYVDFSLNLAHFLSCFQPAHSYRIVFKDEVKGKIIDNILNLIMVARGDEVPERAVNDANSLLKGMALLNGRTEVCYEDAVLVEAILTMCKTVPLEKNKLRYLGDRLSFQLKLRNYFMDYPKVKQSIRNTFQGWDMKSCIYPDNYIDLVQKYVGS